MDILAKWGIRAKLILVIVLVTIPLLALLLYSYQQQRTMEEEEAIDDLRRSVSIIAHEEQNLIDASRELLVALEQMPSIWRAPQVQCAAFLARLQKDYRRYANFGVLEPNGDLYCSAIPGSARTNFANRAYFGRALETRSFSVGDYQMGAIVHKPVLVVALPIVGVNSRVERVLFASISLDWLNREELGIREHLPHGAILTKVDMTGRIFMRTANAVDWIGKQFPDKTILGIALDGSRNEGTTRRLASDGTARLYAFAPLFNHEGKWAAEVILDMPEAPVLSQVKQMIALDLTLDGIVVLAAVASAWLLGSALIARKVTRLAAAAGQLRRGNLSARTGLPHQAGEFGQLARAFDDMAVSIEWREAALRAEEEKYRLLVESANEGVLVVQDGTLKFVNLKLSAMLGYTREELVGRNLSDLIHSEDWPSVEDRNHGRIQGEEVDKISVVRMLTSDNRTKWVEANVAPTRWKEAPAVLGFITDITERVAAKDRLAYLAQHDALTGLANRLLFVDQTERALVRAVRHARHVGVLYFDLDRFQTINDALGLASGDEALKAIAGRLARATRPDDTVARIAGDEFGVLLDDIASPDDIAAIAHKLLGVVAQPLEIARRELHLTASVGISTGPDDAPGADALLDNAGRALDAAKAAGKNTFHFYSSQAHAAAIERLTIESELYRAVENQEFILYYQPRVDLRSGIITGAEALLRWRHPERGIVPPGAFIPVLEQSALIGEVGAWVVQETGRQLAEWNALGWSGLRVSVNVSPHQINKPEFTVQVSQALNDAPVKPGQIELEITESALMNDPARVSDVLQGWKAIGAPLLVDDFGTGYSSLSYLHLFPVDILKVDQSFVGKMFADKHSLAIVRSVIALAHSLGMSVVAEGAETREQAELLGAEGCEEMQGYYFSRPLPAEQFLELLKSDKRLERPPSTGSIS